MDENLMKLTYEIGPEIPKFFSMQNSTKYLFAYWLGLLPFIRIDQDVCSLGYMTRDYLRMKLIEARE
jgi:hypothetical protein